MHLPYLHFFTGKMVSVFLDMQSLLIRDLLSEVKAQFGFRAKKMSNYRFAYSIL